MLFLLSRRLEVWITMISMPVYLSDCLCISEITRLNFVLHCDSNEITHIIFTADIWLINQLEAYLTERTKSPLIDVLSRTRKTPLSRSAFKILLISSRDIIPINQLQSSTILSSEEWSLCRPPSERIVIGHSFTMYDWVWTIPQKIHTCDQMQGPTSVDLWDKSPRPCKNNASYTTYNAKYYQIYKSSMKPFLIPSLPVYITILRTGYPLPSANSN